jgi:glutamyl/glutaminyl-tRNA synthetase
MKEDWIKPESALPRIAMVSTHGYVAAQPPLGAADTGGQVVYVLELSKKLAQLGYEVDIWTRQFEEQPQIEAVAEQVRIIRIPCGGQQFIPKEYLYEKLPAWGENALRFINKQGLKYAFIIKCDEVVKDAAGNVVELRCIADLDSKTGDATANRKVKGTIHWVSAAHAIDAEVRLYDRLFTVPEPDAVGDFKQHINPHSFEVVTAKCEPSLKDARPDLRYQFERLAYFCLDKDSRLSNSHLVLNRCITLKDTWEKEKQKV